MARYLLGTDSGCTVAKAALFSLDGRELAVASHKTELLMPRPRHHERDVDALWQATARTIREVIRSSGVDPREIAAVATAGHGNGLYLVDANGLPVRHAILSTDTRARDYVERWTADGVGKSIRPKTMQAIWPGQPNALLSWLRDNEPQAIERAAWVLMCKDYVRFRLTGNIQAELTDFSGTSLLNVGTARYDDEVLEAFGIADMRRLLPPLVRPEEVCGKVTAAAAAETGLAEGTPVAGGLFDVDACGLSTGLVDESQLCMIAGTWGNNQYISTTPVVDEDVFMTTCYCIPGYYLMLEGSATSASNLEWLATQFFQAERKKAEQEGRSVFDLCNDLVAASAEDSGIVFLPFLFGSNVGPDAKASLVGLEGHHTRGDVLRAIYEGVVFGHHAHVERLMKFREAPATIRLTGGVARSRVWVRIFADCFGVPVELPDGTELGALGAAICAGVAAGIFDTYAAGVEAMVHFARVQEPDPTKQGLYKAKRARYNRLIEALAPAWKDLTVGQPCSS